MLRVREVAKATSFIEGRGRQASYAPPKVPLAQADSELSFSRWHLLSAVSGCSRGLRLAQEGSTCSAWSLGLVQAGRLWLG